MHQIPSELNLHCFVQFNHLLRQILAWTREFSLEIVNLLNDDIDLVRLMMLHYIQIVINLLWILFYFPTTKKENVFDTVNLPKWPHIWHIVKYLTKEISRH